MSYIVYIYRGLIRMSLDKEGVESIAINITPTKTIEYSCLFIEDNVPNASLLGFSEGAYKDQIENYLS